MRSSWDGVETVHGRVHVKSRPFALRRYADAIYVPATCGAASGLFDSRGQVVPEAGTYFGPDYRRISPHAETAATDDLSLAAPDRPYIYCGVMHAHFGHCLLSSFNRFWPWLDGRGPEGHLLMLGGQPFNLPYLGFWLGRLGLAAARFEGFASPVRLREVLVPEPAFEEQWAAHRSFAALCRRVAIEAGCRDARMSTTPVYLSKTQVRSGVQKLANEFEVEDALAAAGVRIVHPQTLPFAEQLKLFWEHPVILGPASSALHNLLFAPRGTRIVAYTIGGILHGNFPLIDAITGSRSRYVAAETDEATPDASFSSTRLLKSPREVVAKLLASIPRGLIYARGLRRVGQTA